VVAGLAVDFLWVESSNGHGIRRAGRRKKTRGHAHHAHEEGWLLRNRVDGAAGCAEYRRAHTEKGFMYRVAWIADSQSSRNVFRLELR